MKSPIQDFYPDANFEQEPLFLSPSGAPAGSTAGQEQDDRDDVSDGELITRSDTELPPDSDQIQSEDQSYRETVRGVRSYMG